MNWYNENEPYAAAWLGNLIREGMIPDGEVCAQDVRTVGPAELEGFTQCHFFAGIGGWPLALRLAGWSEDREVWTGSCPCQPFSVAGKGRGVRDERHLWPAWLKLIAERKPPVIFGEQVASRLGREWLAGVRADLEALGYAVGAADLCAASVGAPHIRQRLWWVADADGRGCVGTKVQSNADCAQYGVIEEQGNIGGVDDAYERGKGAIRRVPQGKGVELPRGACGVGDASGPRSGRHAGAVPRAEAEGSCKGRSVRGQPHEPVVASSTGGPDYQMRLRSHLPGKTKYSLSQLQENPLGHSVGFWSDFDLVACADGKQRRVEPGVQPLAHGVPARVGKLCAWGNAIVPWLAATFIRAFMQSR